MPEILGDATITADTVVIERVEGDVNIIPRDSMVTTTGPVRGGAGGLVRCSKDVRICPDGSYVSRTGTDCTFPPCPEDDIRPLLDLVNQQDANARYDFVAGALQQYLEGVIQATLLWNWVSDLRKSERDAMEKAGRIADAPNFSPTPPPLFPNETEVFLQVSVLEAVPNDATMQPGALQGRIAQTLSQRTNNAVRFVDSVRGFAETRRLPEIFEALEGINLEGVPGVAGKFLAGMTLAPVA